MAKRKLVYFLMRNGTLFGCDQLFRVILYTSKVRNPNNNFWIWNKDFIWMIIKLQMYLKSFYFTWDENKVTNFQEYVSFFSWINTRKSSSSHSIIIIWDIRKAQPKWCLLWLWLSWFADCLSQLLSFTGIKR